MQKTISIYFSESYNDIIIFLETNSDNINEDDGCKIYNIDQIDFTVDDRSIGSKIVNALRINNKKIKDTYQLEEGDFYSKCNSLSDVNRSREIRYYMLCIYKRNNNIVFGVPFQGDKGGDIIQIPFNSKAVVVGKIVLDLLKNPDIRI